MSEGGHGDDPSDPFLAYAPPGPVADELSKRRSNDDGFPPGPSEAPPGTAVVEGWIVIVLFVGLSIAITMAVSACALTIVFW